MPEIKFQTTEDLYQAIISRAEDRGVTVDVFMNEVVIKSISTEENVDFDLELKKSFKQNKEILKGLAER